MGYLCTQIIILPCVFHNLLLWMIETDFKFQSLLGLQLADLSWWLPQRILQLFIGSCPLLFLTVQIINCILKFVYVHYEVLPLNIGSNQLLPTLLCLSPQSISLRCHTHQLLWKSRLCFEQCWTLHVIHQPKFVVCLLLHSQPIPV